MATPSANTLQGKVIMTIVTTLSSIAVALSSFSMKEGYQAKLDIQEMKVRVMQIEKKVEKFDDVLSDVAVINQRMQRLECDIGEIKTDVKKILENGR